MLAYDMPLYRPPSEGRNLIIQATLGCSFNRCTFCSMYRDKQYRVRPMVDIATDIKAAARVAPSTRRVFLADGDALSIETSQLLEILAFLRECFPALTRVSSYALPANLTKKTPAELQSLREAGLTLLYYGIESGSAKVLRLIRKGAQPEMMIQGINKATAAGMKISATVILGLGGRRLAAEHIRDTASMVNQLSLTYLSTLQLGLDASIREEFLQSFGEAYEPQDDTGMLREQVELIRQLEPEVPVIFRSNHASNALPLAGNLPRDRERLLQELAAAARGEIALVPDYLRGY